MKRHLQIGCGKHHLDDYINMDISDVCSPDIRHDIRKGFPMFEDNRFEEVLADGVLEMILPNEEFVFVLNEIWRVLKPGGHLVGQVPGFNPERNNLKNIFYDPFDRRFFQKDTFKYWTKGEHAYNEFGTQYLFRPWHVIKCDFNDNEILCFDIIPADK